MASESLTTAPFPHIPELGAGITSSRNEEFVVWGHSQAHAVTSVSHKHCLLLPRLNVPQGTARREGAPSQRDVTVAQDRMTFLSTQGIQPLPRGVPRASHNVIVIQEAATGEITWRWIEDSALAQGPRRHQPGAWTFLTLLHRGRRLLTCVSREFPADLDIALTGLEAVD